jgi:hypothetical protein
MKADERAAFREYLNTLSVQRGTRDPGILAEAILENYCAVAYRAALECGVGFCLRDGIARAISNTFKKPPAADQPDFAEIESTFGRDAVALTKRLAAESHHVPSRNELVPIRHLMSDRALFDEARKYKRQKGEETITQANAMDQLYAVLWPSE